MKTTVIIAVVLIAMASTVYFSGILPFTCKSSPNDKVKEPPSFTPPPATTQIPVPQPAPAPAPEPEPESPPDVLKEVKFEFAVTGITGSGLSRTISAQLTNTGNTDAHNVWAKVEVFSQDSRIKLGGADSLRVDIGTLKAGNLVIKDVVLEFSIFDGLKIQQNGAKFTLTVQSDEKSVTLYYDYTP
ncbi:hypothetical protein ACFLYL_03610 [Chloroflexota bacterium]